MWQAIAIVCAAAIIVGGMDRINENNNDTKIRQTGIEACSGLDAPDRIRCLEATR